MKKNIHPEWHKTEVKLNGKTVMTVGSTVSEINVEIWSGTHPFYTGEQILVDTDSLVEKFNKKRELASSAGKVVKKKDRRLSKKKEALSKGPVTLKDMLKNLQ